MLFAADLVLVEAVLDEGSKGAGADGEEEKFEFNPIANNELDDGTDELDEEEEGEEESTLDEGTARGVMGIAFVLDGSGTSATAVTTETSGSSFGEGEGEDGISSFTISGTV